MDREVINVRERPLSTDIMDLQSMEQRVQADFMRFLVAKRYEHLGAAVTDDTVPISATLGLSWRGAANLITVQPGMLMQYNTSFPAAPGVLESAMRVGFLRTAQSFAFPAVANTFYLMEIRVVDLNTVVGARDQLDAGTGNFVPVAFTKQVETRIEAQFVAGPPGAYPGFSGGSWVPFCIILTDGAGAFFNTIQADLRQDVRDLMGDTPGQEVYNAQHPAGQLTEQALHTTKPGGAEIVAIGGNVVGRIGMNKMQLRMRDQQIVSLDGGAAPVANAMEHFYLAPLMKLGIEIAPVVTDPAGLVQPAGSVVKGILYRSTVAPATTGRSNGAPLIQPAVFAQYDNIPAGKALHIGTARRNAANTGYTKFSQDAQGRFDRPPTQLGATINALVGAGITQAVDFRVDVPPNARKAKISLIYLCTGAGASYLLELQPRLASGVAESIVAVTVGQTTTSNQSFVVLDVPVAYEGFVTPDEGLRWQLKLTATSGAPTAIVVAQLLGWSF